MMHETILLAGDVGGTKTTLALYAALTWPSTPLREQTYKNDEAAGLVEIITYFLQQDDFSPTIGCFGIAGPIRDNRVQMTNRNWFVDGQEIAQQCGIKQVLLINDLMATAMGAVLLPDEKLKTINLGHPQADGTIAVLAPGTGLGEAFILQKENQLLPVATEGGHASFAPRSREQLELLDFLLQKEEHVSVEKVCSGLGIPNLHAFLAACMEQPESLRQQLAEADDQTPVIVNTALQALSAGDRAHICVHTVQLFVDILAAESANLALKVLATGGVFIGGGIPPRILPFFNDEQFMTVFARGVYREMLADIPVRIILNPKAALLGAAAYGMKQV